MTHIKQPKGFNAFCLTEMWERYGFYIVQYTLSLVLLSTYKLSDIHIYSIMGSFTALAYISPIIGGYLADRIIGFKQAILFGCIALGIGYALLAGGNGSLSSLYLALSIIVLGTGFVKSSVAALLGGQYRDGDNGEQDLRRHKGFSIFYAMLNVGEVIAAISAGYLIKILNWHGLYITASIGLVIGVLVFYFGMKMARVRDQEHKSSLISLVLAYSLCVSLVFGAYFILGNPKLSWYLFAVIVTGAVVLGILRARHCTPMETKHLIGFYLLSMISIVFWAMFFLIYSAMNLYILRVVNHHLAGVTLPVPLYGGIESLGVVLLGPLLGMLWMHLRQRGRDVSTPGKFALGFVFMTITMAILYLATHAAHGDKVSSAWIILAYFVLAAGELSLSAIGLAMVTEYVPKNMTGMMMGVWFVCTGLGGKLSGLFADVAAIPKNVHNIVTIEGLYDHAFLAYFILSAAAVVVSLGLVWYVNRLTAARLDVVVLTSAVSGLVEQH